MDSNESSTDKSVNDTVLLALIANLDQQKSSSRLKTVGWLTFIGFSILLSMIYLYGIASTMGFSLGSSNYVSLVRIQGAISASSPASAWKLLPAIQSAYEDEDSKGVIFLINSPGGSPAQSSIIHKQITTMKIKNPDKKTVVIGEDYVASGAYYIATAADAIYVDDNTLTGSIGVVMESFDLTEAARKLGIERRIMTAGVNKRRLDMFLPMNEDSRATYQTLLSDIHSVFIESVKKDRGARLTGSDDELFNGDIWLGSEALSLGLVDGLGTLPSIMSSEYDVTSFKDYTPQTNFFSRIGNRVSMAITQGVSSYLAVTIQ